MALTKIDKADNTVMPKMINEINWIQIKNNIKEIVRQYIDSEKKTFNE